MLSCKNCYFWEEGLNCGDCHRYPPVINFDVQDEEIGYETLYPITTQDDWCGEFRPTLLAADGATVAEIQQVVFSRRDFTMRRR